MKKTRSDRTPSSKDVSRRSLLLHAQPQPSLRRVLSRSGLSSGGMSSSPEQRPSSQTSSPAESSACCTENPCALLSDDPSLLEDAVGLSVPITLDPGYIDRVLSGPSEGIPETTGLYEAIHSTTSSLTLELTHTRFSRRCEGISSVMVLLPLETCMGSSVSPLTTPTRTTDGRTSVEAEPVESDPDLCSISLNLSR